MANSDRAEATKSNATAIAGGDNAVEMIGQALSAITLGFTLVMAKTLPFPGWVGSGSMLIGFSKSRFAGVKRSICCCCKRAQGRCGRGQHTAITLGLTPGNGEKIAISGLARRRLDGRWAVKEQIREDKTVNFLLPQGSETTLRPRTTQR